jgi:hypothetical protein
MDIIFDGLRNKRITINIVRAYARTVDRIITYRIIQQIGNDFLVLSEWLPDDNYSLHISEHMKNFKLKPEYARLFTAEVFSEGVPPSLIPISLLAEDVKFIRCKDGNGFIFNPTR